MTASEGDAAPDAMLDVDWAAVRRAYEDTGESVDSILKRFRLTGASLRWRRNSEKWIVRPPAAELRAATATRLRRRMLALHGKLLERLEQWVAGSTSFVEEHAHALRLLAAGWEHMQRSKRTEDEMAKQTRLTQRIQSAREKKNKDAGTDFRDDPAWLDAELDRRLERLIAHQENGDDPPTRNAGGKAALPPAVE